MEESKGRLNSPASFSSFFSFCEPHASHSLFDVKQSAAAGRKREVRDDFQSRRLLHRGYFDNVVMICFISVVAALFLFSKWFYLRNCTRIL